MSNVGSRVHGKRRPASARRGGGGTLPDAERKQVEEVLDGYCERLSAKSESYYEYFYRPRGPSVVLWQASPKRRGRGKIEFPFARFRYSTRPEGWGLDWRRANERWGPYEDFEVGRSFAHVLLQVDSDPYGVFFG